MVDAWARAPHSEILIAEVGGLYAVFSNLRGETHLFDAFPSEILLSLEHGPLSAAEIREKLAGIHGDDVGDWLVGLEDVLLQLEGLELVRRVSC